MKLSRKDTKSEFIKKIQELSGQNIYACYQCGKCSAGCPIVERMDIPPNQIIRLIQLGCEKETLDSNTIWFCCTCIQCTAKCPKGVGVAEIMDSLREVLKRQGIDKVELKKMAKDLWNKLPQQALVARFRKFSE